jgi:hypothetical protein
VTLLEQWLVDRVRTMSTTHRYRPPDAEERDRATAALTCLATGGEPDLDGLDLRVTRGADVTGRAFALLTDAPGTERAWGAVVLDEDATRTVVEVPHPGSDRLTARLGLELFRAAPGCALIVAGTRRTVHDAAHRTDSMFHHFAQTLAAPEIQLHGFANDSAPDTDAVVSPGAGRRGPAHEAVEEALAQHGFRTRHHENLAGRTNVQGIAAAERGTPFLHLELAPLLRVDQGNRDRVVDALARTWHQHRH